MFFSFRIIFLALGQLLLSLRTSVLNFRTSVFFLSLGQMFLSLRTSVFSLRISVFQFKDKCFLI